MQNAQIEILREGAQGEAVVSLQERLAYLGYYPDVIDGVFGPETRAAVVRFQTGKGLDADGIVGAATFNALADPDKPVRVYGATAIDDGEIFDLPLPEGQFYRSVYPKRQIVLHHTAGTPDPRSAIRWWETDPVAVATAYVIGGKGAFDGQIYRAFDDKFFAWHLGTIDASVHEPQNLDRLSIGIELCNWGYLRKGSDGKFYNYVGGVVPEKEVCDLGYVWRGQRYFHKYSEKQIESLSKLLKALAQKYEIPFTGKYDITDGWFDYGNGATQGARGLWTHANYRTDKTDLSPQPEMIKMLNAL
jgi:peptidoglycan hydrolase-like protein with peptidoglycan-binding domain